MGRARFLAVGPVGPLGLTGLAGLAALLVTTAAPLPAYGAGTADTTTTFTVSQGTLNTSVPAEATIVGGGPTPTPGSTLEGALGPISMTDERGVSPAPWITTVYATDFTSGGSTIPVSDVAYWSGQATAEIGDGIFTPGQPTRADRAVLGGSGDPVTAFAHSGGTGGNSVTWNPTLVISVPITVLPGTYAGTVTHSMV